MLDYLNGGSRTVTREFYAYLQQRGSIAGGSTTGSTTSTQTTSTKTSFWSRIANFFSGLFGSRSSTSTSAAAPQPSVTVGSSAQYGQVYTSHSSIRPWRLSLQARTPTPPRRLGPEAFLPPRKNTSPLSQPTTRLSAAAQPTRLPSGQPSNGSRPPRPPSPASKTRSASNSALSTNRPAFWRGRFSFHTSVR